MYQTYSLRSNDRVKLATTFTVSFLASVVLFCFSSGCGSGLHPENAVAPPPAAGSDNITGNWQGTLTPKSGVASAIYGSIDQSGSETSAGQFTTSVFRISSECFGPSTGVPAQGFVDKKTVVLNSFGVNQQFVTLNATSTSGGSTLTGTYTVFGGCNNGASGAFAANRYSSLSGTYRGDIVRTDGKRIVTTLVLKQSEAANGMGGFVLIGIATFEGSSCFTSGTLTPDSAVAGASSQVVLATNDRAGSTASLTGTFDQSGATIKAKYQVSGGGCSGESGSATLSR